MQHLREWPFINKHIWKKKEKHADSFVVAYTLCHYLAGVKAPESVEVCKFCNF